MPRRLAAILFADLVGYSSLMGEDEVGTLARLNALRRDVVDPAIADGGGRIVKTMGDGLLVEFASVVDAVNCAMTVARQTSETGPDGLSLRFGVHVGDVIEDAGDLFGDAVNIAARVEAQAEPGGIVMTEDAARHVRGKIGPDLVDLGERRLKNIAEPQRLFAIGATQACPSVRKTSTGHLPTLALEPLRHIGDPAQAYITDGLTEALASALAIFNFFDLVDGVADSPDFLFGGTVQAAGSRARVTVNLTERATGRRIWGTTYDRTTEDPFTMQDDLVATIASTLGEAIPDEAARALATKPEADWSVYDHVMDAMQKMHRLDPEGCTLARGALKKALDIQADNDFARMVLAWVNYLEIRWAPDPDALHANATAIAQDIVRRDERHSGAWRLLSRLALRTGRIDEALAFARRGHGINPYDSDLMINLGTTLVHANRAGEGMPLIERAIRINPYAPTYYRAELALARLICGDPEGALEALKDVSRPVAHSRQTKIVALVELGRLDEARSVLAELLADHPDMTADRNVSMSVDSFAERYREALITAGMPAG